MLQITDIISVQECELDFNFIRSSGPGGQNVNKVATAVQLRFNIRKSKSLSDDIKKRLIMLAGKKVSSDGILIIDARRYRSQERNRNDAMKRLYALIEKAAREPKVRKKKKISQIYHKKRLEEKRKRSEIKEIRKKVQSESIE